MKRTRRAIGYWCMILLIILLLLLTACGDARDGADMLDAIFQNGLLAVQQDGLWGYADQSGRMVIAPQFDDAAWQFGADGTSYVKVGNLWGFIDRRGEFIIEPQFREVGDHFDSHGATYVRGHDAWYFIDKTGTPTSTERFDQKPFPVKGDRYSVVMSDGYRRLIDCAGNWCGDARFQVVEDYWEDVGLYVVKNTGGTSTDGHLTSAIDLYGLIDRDGNVVADIVYDGFSRYPSCQFALVYEGECYGIMSFDGAWIIKPRFQVVCSFSVAGAEGYLWVGEEPSVKKYNYHYGIVDPMGKLILEPTTIFPKQFAIGDMEVVTVPNPDPMAYYPTQYRFVDAQGNFVNERVFDYMEKRQSNGLYLVREDWKFGLVNEDLEWVVEPVFDAIGAFVCDRALVRKDGAYGYIDSEGNYVVEPQYSSAREFSPIGYAYVLLDDKYGVIDTSGCLVHLAKYDKIVELYPSGCILVMEGDHYVLISGRDEVLYDLGEDDVWRIVISPQMGVLLAGEDDYLVDGSGRVWVYDDIQYNGRTEGCCGVVMKDGKYGLIDDNGYLFLPPKYQAITLRGDRYAEIAESGGLRVFDCIERKMGRELYDRLDAVGSGRYLLGERNGRHVLIGESGRVLYTFSGLVNVDGILTVQLEEPGEEERPVAAIVAVAAALILVLGLTFFLTTRHRRDTIKASEREVTHMTTIQWLGQNGYMLEKDGVKLCIDPYLSDSVFKSSGKKRLTPPPIAPEALACDGMVCTHNHLDHLDPDTISVMATKDTTRFFAPYDCEPRMQALGVSHYEKFDPGATAKVGDFELEAVFADHTSKSAIGVVVRVDGLVLLFTGDTYYHEKLREYKRFGVDILFICINGKLGNMNVDEAVQLTGEIGPRVGIPTHYGLFAENTEDPVKYTARVPSHYVMTVGKVITLADIMEGRA